MNNKQVRSSLLTAIMVILITASTATGAGICGTGEGARHTNLVTTQTLPYLLFDSLLNDKPLSPTSSTTVTLTADADATVKSWQPDSNFGSESALTLSYSAIDEVRESVTLLRFDVASALPEDAIIDSASLELFLMDGSGADPAPVAAYFVTSSWAEGNVTWNSFPTAEPTGVVSQVDRSPGSYKSWQVTSFAQVWQSGSNDGVFLRGPVDGTYYERTFESREHSEGVPRLVVTYHLPSPTYTFTGNVYQGSPPETDTPVGGVTVELWGDEDEWPEAGFERVLLSGTGTDGTGAFSLSWEEGDTHYPYLHVIEVDPPGTHSTGARAGESGYVKNFNVVSYPEIPPGTYGGIAFWDQMPEEKPDLVIANIWNEEGRICYLIENVGDGVAPAGQCTALSVDDDVNVMEDCVEEDLAPGAGMDRCFEYNWECTSPEDVVVVCTDHGGVVDERDEENNCMEQVFECSLGAKSDLVTTDLWNEGSTICYQIRNIGEGVAPGGHCTALIVDGEYRVCDPVDQALDPGERLRGCFDYGWECTSPEDVVVVVADYEEGVTEDNETNNQREEVWKCDVIPPQIVHGPIVQEVTRNSAVIFWETDEASDSVVRHGKTAKLYDLEEGDLAMVKGHSITLSRLEPFTTYNFVVQSIDTSGNTVVSDEVTFETLHLLDAIDPTVSIINLGVCRGLVTISAEAEDNMGVEKVEFFIDDKLVFTDYTPPYELSLDTGKYENGEYTLEARAYDSAGRFRVQQVPVEIANIIDITAPEVNIYHPSDGATVSGDQRILVLIEDDTGVNTVEFFIHGKQIACYNYPTTPTNIEFSVSNPFWWDTRFWENKYYTVAVRATDEDGKTSVDTVNVKVSNPEPPLRPKLVITKHNVTRHKNYFGIDLWVKNEGKARAENIEIRDSLRAFQPISEKVGSVDYKSDFNPSTWEGSCIITDTLGIDPGHSRYYTFKAVPVLIHPNPPKPSIGDSIKLTYGGSYGVTYSETPVSFTIKETTLNYPNVPIATAYNDAIKEADYLIVTNRPWLIFCNLFQLDDVNTLFSDMGQLAMLRNGVLGYFSSSYVSRDTIRDLIEPGGDWAKKLNPKFSKPLKGYLLIVGETEIVPAWQQSEIKYSDHPYADTTGSGPPALIVGRVIGDSAANLTKPIQASIGVFENSPGNAFDRDNALVISDPGIGPFVRTVDTVGANLLRNGFKKVEKMHWKYYFRVQPPFYRDYESHDGFAVGDMVGDTKDEIVIADMSANKISILNSSGTLIHEFNHYFTQADTLAVGDVTGDTKEEIIVGDASGNKIVIYSANGTLIHEFNHVFDDGDSLAAGDVIGSGTDQILHADLSHDYIYIMELQKTSSGGLLAVVVDSFSASFDKYDGFAVGDVMDDAKEEVIISDIDLDKVFVRRMDTSSWSWFERKGKLEKGDGFAVGNVQGLTKNQILIADVSIGQIYVYRWNGAKWAEGREISCTLKKYDGFAAGDIGDIMGTQKDEAIIASGDDYIDILDTTNWVQRVRNKFPILVQDIDVIYYQGHGGSRVWNAPIRTHPDAESVFPIDFNDHNPFVLGTSCNTGDYEYGGKLDYKNIAESFLYSGAAVYIGSTVESAICLNREAGKKFYEDWNADECVGWAFTDLERDRWSVHGGWRYWVKEYNIYGDPKFGAVSHPDSEVSSLSERSSPPSSLEIDLPNYTVNVDYFGDDLDYVEIPGGEIWLVENELQVPFYSTSIDVPPEYRVRDLILSERFGLVTDTGLNLPVTSDNNIGPIPHSGTLEGWFPNEDYRFEILENPDGTSTLIIVIYPFHYNPLTTDVRFYKNYSFDINYTISPVAITTLSTDRAEYQQGDMVMVDIRLNNSGEARDVVFSASVKRYGSDEVADGLLLRTLKEFTGLASFSPQWGSGEVEPGYYSVEVTLKDTGGDVLDRKTEMFRLGVSSGEIVSFTATPECFDIGDEIGIEMAFGNNGTVNITGTAIIRVLNSTGYATEEFRHNVTNLTPSGSVIFSDAWDTSGAEAGSSYTIIGYVLYDSKSTDPATVTVWNMVKGDLNRDGVVTPADAAIVLELAAIGEYNSVADVDCDGQITALDALMILQTATGNIELEGGES